MFTRTRPSGSHRCQGATLSGLPLGVSVAITAGLGSRRSAWTSSGSGGLGMAPGSISALRAALHRDREAVRGGTEVAVAAEAHDDGDVAALAERRAADL